MTLAEIRAAVEAGTTVHWANESYRVIKDRLGQYLVIYTPNGNAIGLTDHAGQRLNGREADFFVAQAGANTSGGQGSHACGDRRPSPERCRGLTGRRERKRGLLVFAIP
ncbi:hypothetical protein M4578_19415 [Salipiger sp. P9]|uniref:hypothetical protein n=1 Tax=Salipiger pentaromativorans TaxID=2943193 RepID=UPI0021588483|nr:hypothetical protein [Salipiger pentaromativorans]MCR8550000.1 hypothetical protein [Salipiger pentaromativorans]